MNIFEQKLNSFNSAPTMEELEDQLGDELVSEIREWASLHDNNGPTYDVGCALLHLAKRDFIKLL